MNRFGQLHDSNGIVYVNGAKVRGFRSDGNTGSIITFDNGEQLTVTEGPAQLTMLLA